MKRNPFLVIAAALLTALLLLAPAASAEQKQRTLFIEVDAAFKPQSAVGLLLDPAGTREFPATIEALDGGRYRVQFTADVADDAQGVTASALLLAEDGVTTAIGGVRSLELAAAAPEPAPECAPEGTLRGDSLTIYEKLIKLREERRNLFKQGAQKALDKELVQKLTTLERGFGLDTEPPLSADLNPVVLVDRLFRLQEALRQYVASRQAAKQQQRAGQ